MVRCKRVDNAMNDFEKVIWRAYLSVLLHRFTKDKYTEILIELYGVNKHGKESIVCNDCNL